MSTQTPSTQEETRKKPSFWQQEVDFTEVAWLPEGYERLFLGIYFIIIPYLAGLLFLFIFVAKADFDSFLSLDIAMFAAVWAIGYEVCAAVTLAAIFYKMFQFNRGRGEPPKRTRERKETDLYKVHKLS